MLIREDDQWLLHPYNVVFTEYGEERKQWALPSTEWWLEYADHWEEIEIQGFEKVELSNEQMMRYEEVRYLPDDENHAEYTQYILTGNVKDATKFSADHPFRLILVENENETLKEENNMLKLQTQAQADRSQFIEDLIAQMAIDLYS